MYNLEIELGRIGNVFLHCQHACRALDCQLLLRITPPRSLDCTSYMVVSHYTAACRSVGMPPGMPHPRHAGRHAWQRRDSVDRHSYLMCIMLIITCQSLFKMDDEVVACVASAGFLMIAGAVQFQRRRRRKRTVWMKPWIQVRPVLRIMKI